MPSDDGREFKVALSSALPSEDMNGWDDDDFAATLDADRGKVRCARISYNVLHQKTMTSTGKKILTIQLLQIEPTEDAGGTEQQMLAHLRELRTGQATLFANDED